MQSWSDHALCLGIDMGATSLRASVVGPGGRVLETVRTLLPAEPVERVALPVEVAARYADRVEAVGLAIAGTVAAGRMNWSANLGIADVDYVATIQSRLGIPTVVLNDARAAGLAEAQVGAGAGAGLVLALTVGTGVGGALLLDGKVVEGTGNAGEVGHLVIDAAGPECGCGERGCWEALVGGRALAAIARTSYPQDAEPLTTMVAAAEKGDTGALQVIDRATDYFRQGLDSLAAVLAPDVVVLGGGMIARDNLLTRRYLNPGPLRWLEGRLVKSELGDLAGQVGAALAAHSLLARD